MTGRDIANSPLLFALIALGLFSIIVFSLVCYKKAKAKCISIGISTEKVSGVVKATITASLIPSFAILVGFLILAASMGSAWPWWRLSVIGSLSYETMAADYTVKGMGIALGNLLTGDARLFAGVMFVMTIGVFFGPLVVGAVGEKYSTGLMKAKDTSDWGTIMTSTFSLSIFAVYIPIMIFSDLASALTMITSLIVAVIFGLLSRKVKGLGNFIMAICMILGMLSGVLWDKLIK